MLWVTNSQSEALTANQVVPLDTTICATNDNVNLNGNSIKVTTPGWYVIGLDMVLASTAGATVIVQMYTQGNEVVGASQTAVIAANGTQLISMEWPVHVVSTTSGTASINWQVSSAVNMESVVAKAMAVI